MTAPASADSHQCLAWIQSDGTGDAAGRIGQSSCTAQIHRGSHGSLFAATFQRAMAVQHRVGHGSAVFSPSCTMARSVLCSRSTRSNSSNASSTTLARVQKERNAMRPDLSIRYVGLGSFPYFRWILPSRSSTRIGISTSSSSRNIRRHESCFSTSDVPATSRRDAPRARIRRGRPHRHDPRTLRTGHSCRQWTPQ